jgi:hypothetical protein
MSMISRSAWRGPSVYLVAGEGGLRPPLMQMAVSLSVCRSPRLAVWLPHLISVSQTLISVSVSVCVCLSVCLCVCLSVSLLKCLRVSHSIILNLSPAQAHRSFLPSTSVYPFYAVTAHTATCPLLSVYLCIRLPDPAPVPACLPGPPGPPGPVSLSDSATYRRAPVGASGPTAAPVPARPAPPAVAPSSVPGSAAAPPTPPAAKV